MNGSCDLCGERTEVRSNFVYKARIADVLIAVKLFGNETDNCSVTAIKVCRGCFDKCFVDFWEANTY